MCVMVHVNVDNDVCNDAIVVVWACIAHTYIHTHTHTHT